ncbi:hypothetical protein [Streptomyces murinus]|uniref:hypothetical protein n=1 Tax=Streptomyces murinus TaxID=33900 RepID=UPI00211493E5|nr:hypothetical protein [Streptomyces murinus]
MAARPSERGGWHRITDSIIGEKVSHQINDTTFTVGCRTHPKWRGYAIATNGVEVKGFLQYGKPSKWTCMWRRYGMSPEPQLPGNSFGQAHGRSWGTPSRDTRETTGLELPEEELLQGTARPTQPGDFPADYWD